MKKLPVSTCLLSTLFIGGPVLRAQNAPSATKITHVLVISIDGMHSQDLAKWVSANPSSTLAQLTATGVNYPNASTTQPSDSIPSTVGIFSGASPSLGGMYYDDAWHRVWAPSFNSGKACNAGVPNGTAIDLKQGIDFDGNSLDAGGGINPDNLPRDPFNNCAPVYPHHMLRVNTIFEVVKAAGMYTAYSEKRPSYDFLNGPSGAGVQDLYTPEINFFNLLVPAQIEAFDDLRVTSVINEINELNHDGTAVAPLPALFGMNFQAVNSAKKASATSGYADSSGTPDAILMGALSYVDNRIGSMLAAFPQGQLKKTAIIITAKHGESPFGNQRTIVSTNLIGSILTAAGIPTHKITQKTSALIWLTNQAQTAAAVAALNASLVLAPNLHEVLSFGSPDFPFPDPTVDPAVPDIVVVMNDGVNFEPSGSTTFAEHGGFGEPESHVPLLISNPGWTASSLTCTVATRQIAPTVLALLGLDPNALQAVQIEGTPVLPFTLPCP
jgi:Type I phosphodiesterase / nucleotide pyrophosphatase